MSRKKTKICLVCGKDFLGNEAAFTCGTACRTYMSRNLKKGKKPEFYFVAKSKGQKVPIFEKEILPKSPKKELPKNNTPETPTPPEIDNPTTVTLSKEQILSKVAELNRNIETIKREVCPTNKHPKIFALNQEMRVSEIEDEITRLTNPT